MIDNCTKCEHHEIIPDPDPNDWFCDDDVAVICKKAPGNPRFDSKSKYYSERQDFKCITVACRPYHIEKECQTPGWCPLTTNEVV